jgi:hypothetical protein
MSAAKAGVTPGIAADITVPAATAAWPTIRNNQLMTRNPFTESASRYARTPDALLTDQDDARERLRRH